ncbi:MAG TPA: hypothetical protein VGK89_10205 [Candidatus Eisenbacteria bacterium]|jgi:hypothetical protein
MKRVALLLLSVSLLAIGGPAFATGGADEVLISFTGFDYQDPNLNSLYLDVGEGYKVVGFVTSAGPLIAPYIDPTSYEYTIYIRDLTVTTRFFTFPNLTVLFANNGRGSYYADNFPPVGTAGTYGINPPNATSPSTFTDANGGGSVGERITGDIDNMVLVYNFSTSQGSFSGAMTLDGGPDLIYVPPSQRAGWVLGGIFGPPNPSIPTGYDHQVEGECRIPGKTPAAHRTWGALKALYR